MTYRDFLRQQVKEKERKKEEEKRQQMMEEQKELERLEKERKKLEEDFKRERERERQREEEAKSKNEEIKREAEEKKRQAALAAEEEQRREAEQERHLAEARLRALAEKMSQPLPQRRTYSPPIPTLRNKENHPPPQSSVTTNEQSQIVDRHEETVFLSSSPPIPAVLKKMAKEQKTHTQSETKESATLSQVQARVRGTNSPPSAMQAQQQSSSSVRELPASISKVPRGGSPLQSATQPAGSTTVSASNQPSDILKQLAAMRMHLQSELAKKDALQAQQRPEYAGMLESDRHQQQRHARMPGPRIARPKDGATLNALNQFTQLKYTNPLRGDFVRKYPDFPETGSVLELQQDALLRHQEQQQAGLKAGMERDRGRGFTKVTQKRHHALFDGDPLASETVNLPLGNRGDPFHPQNLTHTSAASQDHVTASTAIRGRSGITARGDGDQPPADRRRQWGDGRRGEEKGRVPSAGGLSQFSVTTFDVDSIAMRNDERARRLDAILNAGTSHGGSGVSHPHPGPSERGSECRRVQNLREDPQTILHDFLRRRDRGGGSRQSERSLDCETEYQTISSPHS